jgi:hypothetical protein
MERAEAYFERKGRELALIAGALRSRTKLAPPDSVEDVIETKFRLAAALRAEFATAAWAHTETRWNTAPPLRAGPFAFSYRYQRADLAADGPLPYPASLASTDVQVHQLTYTCSGMAAISALLQAMARRGNFGVLFTPGNYKETIELAARYLPALRVVDAEQAAWHRGARKGELRALWLDSSNLGIRSGFDTTLRSGDLDLIVCDTTCFAAQSGRIRRVIGFARRARTPLVLVRSHMKLDSLGTEFGRLGSILFLAFPDVPLATIRLLRDIAREMREAIRLSGTAALPAHFCPFFGSSDYWALSAARCKGILRNARALVGTLARNIGYAALQQYPHGLFVALLPPARWDEPAIAEAADDLAGALARGGLPVRHAGSFGFDFVATEAFFDTQLDHHVLRIAPADLPTELFAEVADGIACWWLSHFHARAA